VAERNSTSPSVLLALEVAMREPHGPERDEWRTYAISVVISLVLVVLALQMYAELGMA
jgi:hypothetical protein